MNIRILCILNLIIVNIVVVQSQIIAPLIKQQTQRRRELWDMSINLEECMQCWEKGMEKETCWDVLPDGSGDWHRSKCCGEFDNACRHLYYCSSSTSSLLQKKMTCPVDISFCEGGKDKILDFSAIPYGQ